MMPSGVSCQAAYDAKRRLIEFAGISNEKTSGVNILETQPIIIGEQFQILGKLGKSFWVSWAKTEYLVPRL